MSGGTRCVHCTLEICLEGLRDCSSYHSCTVCLMLISLVENHVLNDLSKKTLNVHNDGTNDMILSSWTFRVLLDKSFRTSFSSSDVVLARSFFYT